MTHRAMTLKDLLANLQKKADDDYARVSWRGRVLSKSDKNLHMALPSGIVAIPFADIESVHVSEVRSDVVTITVRNADRVKHLVTVEQQETGQPLASLPFMRQIINDGRDTPSYSGPDGLADDCADWLL